MEEALCRTSLAPLAPPCLFFVYARWKQKGFSLDYQGRAGIISALLWNLRPGIFGVNTRHVIAKITFLCVLPGGSPPFVRICGLKAPSRITMNDYRGAISVITFSWGQC